MKSKTITLLLGFILAVSAGFAAAQSLGDIARAQKEKQDKEKKPAKIYSNENLPEEKASPEQKTDAPPNSKGTASGGMDADKKEIRDYRLSMEKVNKWFAASKPLFKVVADDPNLAKQMQAHNPGINSTTDEAVKVVEQYPKAGSAIKAAGLPTREYLVMTQTLGWAIQAVDMKKQRQLKEYPQSISPENAAFVEQNYDKLAAMMGEMNAATSGK